MWQLPHLATAWLRLWAYNHAMAAGTSKLEELVKCAVCLDVYQQPKTLQCNHGFCLACIRSFGLQLGFEGKKEIKCPLCSKSTALPDGGPDALPADFRINEMIEVYQLTVQQPAAGNKCMEHNRELEIYCEDCNEAYCVQCAHRDHRSHKSDFIYDAFAKNKSKIKNWQETLKQHLSKVSDALQILNLQEKEITEQGHTLKAEIESLVQQIVKVVQQSGKALKEQIDRCVQQKLENIVKKQEDGKNIMTKITSSMECVTKIESESKEVLLKEKQQIKEKVAYAIQASEGITGLASTEKADITFQQDNDVVKKCSNIGKVSVGSQGIGSTGNLDDMPDLSICEGNSPRVLGGTVTGGLGKIGGQGSASLGRDLGIEGKGSGRTGGQGLRLGTSKFAGGAVTGGQDNTVGPGLNKVPRLPEPGLHLPRLPEPDLRLPRPPEPGLHLPRLPEPDLRLPRPPEPGLRLGSKGIVAGGPGKTTDQGSGLFVSTGLVAVTGGQGHQGNTVNLGFGGGGAGMVAGGQLQNLGRPYAFAAAGGGGLGAVSGGQGNAKGLGGGMVAGGQVGQGRGRVGLGGGLRAAAGGQGNNMGLGGGMVAGGQVGQGLFNVGGGLGAGGQGNIQGLGRTRGQDGSGQGMHNTGVSPGGTTTGGPNTTTYWPAYGLGRRGK